MKGHWYRGKFGIIALVVSSIFAWACHANQDPKARAEKFVEHVTDKLELKDHQIAALKNLADALVALKLDFNNSKEKSVDQLFSAISGDNLDIQSLQGIYEEKRLKLDQAVPNILAKLAAFHASLEPGQKTKWQEYSQKWQAKIKSRFHG